MSMSTFHKVTLVSCVLLCVALLLPKMLLSGGRRDAAMKEGPVGHFSPVMQRKSVPMLPRAAGGSRPHNPEAIARAKGSTGTGGKSNLAGQIIPVYGFGILLYILYIIFKITSKGKTSKPHESRFPAVRSENMKRKITDFELTQLQERLKETEEVMERIVSRARAQHENTASVGDGGMSEDQEEKLLLQLREITRVMQEGCLVDALPSEIRKQDQDHQRQFTQHEVWTPPCSNQNQNQSEGGTEVEPPLSCCKRNRPAERSDDVRVDEGYDDIVSGGGEGGEEISVLSSRSEDQNWMRSSGGAEIRRRRGTEEAS